MSRYCVESVLGSPCVWVEWREMVEVTVWAGAEGDTEGSCACGGEKTEEGSRGKETRERNRPIAGTKGKRIREL